MKKIVEDVKALEDAGIITPEQFEKAQKFFETRYENTVQFDLIHVLYYFGALLAISAMTWLMTQGWDSFGGAGLAGISFMYAVMFTLAGRTLWKKNLQVPGGLLMTLAVCMTPLFVYGVQRATEFWIGDHPNYYRDFHIWIESSWVLMSTATVLVGWGYIWKIRFGFLTMPIAVALWYLSMDTAPLIQELLYPSEGDASWSWWAYRDLRSWVSIVFGLAMIFTSYFFDRRTKVDFSFWLYLFGLMTFWGGLTSLDSDSELGKFIYFSVNLVLIGISIFLQRSAFAVFGALGSVIYLSHLSRKVFEDSILFPIVLVLIGLGVIFIGVQIQKNKKSLMEWVDCKLPAWLNELRPQKRI